MTLTEFLLARIAEDKKLARPQTIVISGGTPAPEVPNCVGVDDRGCEYGWRLDPEPEAGWWRRDDVQNLMVRHSLTHVTPEQRRVLAECEAKRRIVEEYDGLTFEQKRTADAWEPYRSVMRNVLLHLARPYADHPDYQQEWRP